MICRNVQFTLVLVLLTGCISSHTWKNDQHIIPSTYTVAGKEVPKRSIGKLRQLIVLPANLQYTGYGSFLKLMSRDDAPDRLLYTFGRLAGDYLTNSKGYELLDFNSSTPTAHTVDVPQDVRSSIGALATWAIKSQDGADTPEDVVAAVKMLGQRAEVDGIMLLHGWGKELSDEAYLAVLLTASLAWPVLLAETKISLSADLFEVSSGKIVWRSRISSTNAADLRNPESLISQMFAPIEDALPQIFTR